MAKKTNYEAMFTLRKDGRWQKVVNGKCLIDRDPERLMQRVTDAGNPLPPAPPTFREAAEDWLEAHEQDGIAYRTKRNYVAPLKRLNDAFGDRLVTEIAPAEIKAFINGLAKKGFKRTTVQRPLDMMRMIYDHAITASGSCVTFNPCASVGVPSGLKQERRDLASLEDIEKVKRGAALPFGLFACLLLYSGLREGEALALMDTDFNFEAGSISVSKAICWQPNKPVIKEPKTKASVRTVILLDSLRAVLPKQWTGYLFSSDAGKSPLSQIEFRHRWKQYCIAAGLADPEIVERTVEVKTALKHQEGKLIKKTYKRTVWHYRLVPHQLRHEFATLCFDAEIPAKDTQEMLGHAKVETTEAIYTHIREARREKMGKRLNEYINSVSTIVSIP